jgi:hypothetical protein
MNKKMAAILAAATITAACAGAQITVGASYLGNFNPSRSQVVTGTGAFTNFLAVSADMNVCALHGGLELLFAGTSDLGFNISIDFNFVRLSAPKSGLAFTFGAGLEPWLEFFPRSSLFSVLAHFPMDFSWQPSAQFPMELFLKLSPNVGVALTSSKTTMIYGMDGYLGLRFVLVSA